MDYAEKVSKLKEHIGQHPTDYQAVIALLHANSDMIEHERHRRKIERLKRVADYRRQYNGD